MWFASNRIYIDETVTFNCLQNIFHHFFPHFISLNFRVSNCLHLASLPNKTMTTCLGHQSQWLIFFVLLSSNPPCYRCVVNVCDKLVIILNVPLFTEQRNASNAQTTEAENKQGVKDIVQFWFCVYSFFIDGTCAVTTTTSSKQRTAITKTSSCCTRGKDSIQARDAILFLSIFSSFRFSMQTNGLRSMHSCWNWSTFSSLQSLAVFGMSQ